MAVAVNVALSRHRCNGRNASRQTRASEYGIDPATSNKGVSSTEVKGMIKVCRAMRIPIVSYAGMRSKNSEIS